MDELELDNPFWRFSLRVYSAKGVSDECISLQDRFDLNVNIILFSAWVGMKGLALEPEQLAEANALVHDWNTLVVKPLRLLRRRLKGQSELLAEASRRFRPSVAETELKAEQIEQATLYASSLRMSFPSPAGRAEHAVDANLALVLNGTGLSASEQQLRSLAIASRIYAD